MFFLRLILLFSAAAAGGCETVGRSLGKVRSLPVSGDACGHADWFEVGRVDGLSGVTEEVSVYVGRCVSQGRSFDRELYQAGWQKGLTEYCTADRGYDAGRSGAAYLGICPPHMEASFLTRFNLGAKIADLERKNAALEKEIDARLAKLNSSPPPPSNTILSDVLQRQKTQDQQNMLSTELQKLRDLRARNELEIRELESN